MTTTVSLHPIFRRSVGFDRFDDLFNQLSQTDDHTTAYPPYNIEKHGENRYVITMALAGFRENELTVTAHHDQLKISGRMEDRSKEEEGIEFLHRGIAARAFERSFRLADHMKVCEADYADGLLRVTLEREVPEEAKPRMIPIRKAGVTALESKAAKKA